MAAHSSRRAQRKRRLQIADRQPPVRAVEQVERQCRAASRRPSTARIGSSRAPAGRRRSTAAYSSRCRSRTCAQPRGCPRDRQQLGRDPLAEPIERLRPQRDRHEARSAAATAERQQADVVLLGRHDHAGARLAAAGRDDADVAAREPVVIAKTIVSATFQPAPRRSAKNRSRRRDAGDREHRPPAAASLVAPRSRRRLAPDAIDRQIEAGGLDHHVIVGVSTASAATIVSSGSRRRPPGSVTGCSTSSRPTSTQIDVAIELQVLKPVVEHVDRRAELLLRRARRRGTDPDRSARTTPGSCRASINGSSPDARDRRGCPARSRTTTTSVSWRARP